MIKNNEKLIAANLTKIMAMMCVRNTKLEGLHAGVVPVSKTGDFSDVIVVDASGREIPWTEVSHFDDDIMRDWMRDVVNKLDTFQLNVGDPYFQKVMARWASVASKWDDPELDKGFMQAIELIDFGKWMTKRSRFQADVIHQHGALVDMKDFRSFMS